MNERVDTAEYEFLWKLLANPADPNHSYIFNLQSLVSDFPQSGALRALLMPNGDKKHLKHAAAYFNPRVLHKLATAPGSLAKVTDDQIVFSDGPDAAEAEDYYNLKVAEPFVPPVIEEAETAYTPVVDDSVDDETLVISHAAESERVYNTFSEPEIDPYTAEQAEDPLIEDVPVVTEEEEEEPGYTFGYDINNDAVETSGDVAAFTPASENRFGTAIDDELVHDEIAEAPIVEQIRTEEPPAGGDTAPDDWAVNPYEYLVQEDTEQQTVSSFENNDRYFHQPIEDEVYDEIVSIEDIGLEQLAILNKSAQEGNENYFVFEPEAAPVPVADTTDPASQAADEAPAGSTQPETKAVNEVSPLPAAPIAAKDEPVADAKRDMSMYHDDKMPYSFMWWLDKTRKQHADIYQPYVKHTGAVQPQAPLQPLQREPIDELQKQYFQSIVSTTPFTDLDKVAPKIPPVRKEDKIIERFIQEEPHIKHPTGVKLDNENKAKSSSEDREELVTETLAKIYTEQMLYHKAILTYKKLMLKYPEKSLYFAGQIEQLESKIN